MSHRPFRFGVINEALYPREGWLDHVRCVEELGYDTFLLRDHFIPDFFGDQYAPLVALTAAAMRTQRLRVGTLVIDNDYRHPVMLAKEAATLDVLSGGRLELGIGAGWQRGEYAQAGMAFESAGVRISRLEEALKVIKGLWAAEPLTFQGQHYGVAALDGVPKPAQRPHPPILVGAGQSRMLRLAGREADIVSVLTTSVASGTVVDNTAERLPDAVMQKIEWIRQGAGERFGQIELNLIPTVILTDRRRERTEQLIAERGWAGVSVEDMWAMPSVLIGSVEQMVEDVLARRETYGFSYYTVSDSVLDTFAPVVAGLSGK
ncbi:MAG: TIGR03621 family F420-dependent LLM class oxidoreductase [Anaerolineae bacterium]